MLSLLFLTTKAEKCINKHITPKDIVDILKIKYYDDVTHVDVNFVRSRVRKYEARKDVLVI